MAPQTGGTGASFKKWTCVIEALSSVVFTPLEQEQEREKQCSAAHHGDGEREREREREGEGEGE